MTKLSIKEIIENVQEQMTLASNKIKELKSQLGDPVGTQDHVTEDDMLIFDMEYWMEKFKHIEYTIISAIMVGVYAGNIEGMGKGFVDEFGADSIKHCYEYLKIAENFKIPWDNNGKIASDVVHDELSKTTWHTYAKQQEDNSESSMLKWEDMLYTGAIKENSMHGCSTAHWGIFEISCCSGRPYKDGTREYLILLNVPNASSKEIITLARVRGYLADAKNEANSIFKNCIH